MIATKTNEKIHLENIFFLPDVKYLCTLNLVGMCPTPEETLKIHFGILFLTCQLPWPCVFWVLSNLWRQPARTKRNSEICCLANLWLSLFQLPLLGCRDKLSTPDGMSTLFLHCGQFWTRASDEKRVFSSERLATVPGSFSWSFRSFAMFMQIPVDRTVSQNATQKPITNNQMPQQCKFGSVSDFFFPFCFVRFIHPTVLWNNGTDS